MCARLNYHKVLKMELSRLIPRKVPANTEVVVVHTVYSLLQITLYNKIEIYFYCRVLEKTFMWSSIVNRFLFFLSFSNTISGGDVVKIVIFEPKA